MSKDSNGDGVCSMKIIDFKKNGVLKGIFLRALDITGNVK